LRPPLARSLPLGAGGRRYGRSKAPRRSGYGAVGSWHFNSPRAEQPRDITSDHVDFEIDPLPGDGRAEIGARQRVRDDVHAEAIRRHLIDREAHSIHGNRALWRDERSQLFWDLKHKADGFGFGTPLGDTTDRVHMTGDKVAAQLVTGAQRPFEIDRGS